MNTYLKNFWSLYLDFIYAFEEVAFKNIPLPLYCNFYQYLEPSLKEQMLEEKFINNLQYKLENNEQIQKSFEELLSPVSKPLQSSAGKIVLNYDYLRFTPENYTDIFSPEEALILARWKKQDMHGLGVENIKEYQINTSKEVETVIKKVRERFNSLKHPVLSNSYLQDKFLSSIPNMLNFLYAVENFLDKNNPSCIIVGTTEEIISRALAISTRLRGIPSICLQHGLLMGEEAYLPIFTSKVAVYGSYEKEWFIERGAEEDKIAIIGHPRFDSIFKGKYEAKECIQKEYNLDEKKKSVLVATQPFKDKYWIDIIEELAKDESLEILIKPHPWEIGKKKYDFYEKLSEKYKNVKLILTRGVNIHSFIAAVDAVVVSLSTVGLEAMLLEKPVVILKEVELDRDYDYYDRMREFILSNPQKLGQLTKKIIYDESIRKLNIQRTKQFLASSYHGKLSGPRLAELIRSISNI